jgi:predicted metallopeptidase
MEARPLAIPRVRARRAERPNATLLCRRIVDDMSRKLPELGHVRASRILFVAGEARRGSRATIRPLGDGRRPKVVLKGRTALYCVTLRPKFFRSSDPEQRVATLLHELLHIAKPFDGTLDPERRHSKVPPPRFEALLRPLVKRYLQEGDAALLGAIAHHGEVLARQWLERPTGRGNGKRTYSEKDLFLGPVQMITRRRLHS